MLPKAKISLQSNICDTLYQLIWSKCRRHFAPNRHRSLADLTSALREAHLCASAQPRAMRSAALRAAFCISIGYHRSKTDNGSQKEEPEAIASGGFIHHAEGVYIINAKHCISSTRSVVYYQAAGKRHADA